MSTLCARLFLATALAVTAACGGGSTRDLDPDRLQWVEYRHPTAGYSMSLPAVMEAREDGNDVLFGYDGGVPVLVRLTTEEEARGRGAWFGHAPEGPAHLDGIAGQRFIYQHTDGPFVSRTIAYVVPQGDRFLGLEFRCREELDPVQERILASFRLP